MSKEHLNPCKHTELLTFWLIEAFINFFFIAKLGTIINSSGSSAAFFLFKKSVKNVSLSILHMCLRLWLGGLRNRRERFFSVVADFLFVGLSTVKKGVETVVAKNWRWRSGSEKDRMYTLGSSGGLLLPVCSLLMNQLQSWEFWLLSSTLGSSWALDLIFLICGGFSLSAGTFC